MRVDYSIASGGWGGVQQAYGSPQDWTLYDACEFWFYGNDTGNTIRLELYDNRSDDSTDTSERFEHTFTDTVTGWTHFSIPWNSFERRTEWQPSGAPDDDLTLTEVWGYNFTALNGSGRFRIDKNQLCTLK
jgi:hypothetical protein